MKRRDAKWRSYEQVANHLLNSFAEEFGLSKVEGKQKILGLRSETPWEIEGKALVDGGKAFLIIECRRYPRNRLDQESVGGLAFRISDTGAKGGIIVSPLGLQQGAKKVAASSNIISVTLNENASSTDYVMKFMDKVRAGISLSGHVDLKSSLRVQVRRKDGTVEDLSPLK